MQVQGLPGLAFPPSLKHPTFMLRSRVLEQHIGGGKMKAWRAKESGSRQPYMTKDGCRDGRIPSSAPCS
jgi:hypothetical protein